MNVRDNNKLYPRLLAFVIIAYIPIMAAFNLMRLWGFGFELTGLGVFNQLMFNLCNGDIFLNSIEPSSNFIIFPLIASAPVYCAFPAPETLNIIHLLLVSLTGVIIYKTCRKLKIGADWSCFWAMVYLFNPVTLYHALFSFQEASFATPLLALVIYFLISRNFSGLLITGLFLVLTKEHHSITVAALGLLWVLYNKNKSQGFGILIAGIVCFAFFYTINNNKDFFYNYFTPLVPAIIAACALAVHKLKSKKIPAYVITMAALIFMIFIFEPLLNKLKLVSQPGMEWSNGKKYKEAAAIIPADAFVMADNFSGVAISGRKHIAVINTELSDKADHVFIRISPYRYGPFYEDMSLDILNQAEYFMNAKNWGLIYWNYPYAVFKKDGVDIQNKKDAAELIKLYRSMAPIQGTDKN